MIKFGYENLDVWNRAVDFAVSVIQLVETIDTAGKAREQVVFWELKRRKNAIYFLKNGFECDFMTISAGGIKNVIQVCHDISDTYTLKREVKGITAAAKKVGFKRGTIITYDEQNTILENDVSIEIVPLPIFLCEN